MSGLILSRARYAALYGPTAGDRIRLADTDLLIEIEDDLSGGLLEADYVVIEMARQILGENWLPDYVARANAGGIERVLV